MHRSTCRTTLLCPELLALLRRYAHAARTRSAFDAADEVQLDGVVRPAWRDLVVTRTKDGPPRVNRINDELATLHTVQGALGRGREPFAQPG